jgi:hypothetical protein
LINGVDARRDANYQTTQERVTVPRRSVIAARYRLCRIVMELCSDDGHKAQRLTPAPRDRYHDLLRRMHVGNVRSPRRIRNLPRAWPRDDEASLRRNRWFARRGRGGDGGGGRDLLVALVVDVFGEREGERSLRDGRGLVGGVVGDGAPRPAAAVWLPLAS